MTYNTTVFLTKSLVSAMWTLENANTDLVDSFWCEKDSNYLDVIFEFFWKDDDRDFQLVQNITMGESNFNQFKQPTNHLVVTNENFASEHTVSPIEITISSYLEEQLNFVHTK